MVHGKFEGTVTAVDHGRTYYARYVDGQRKGNWSRDPNVAKAKSAEPTAATVESKKAPSVPAKLTAAEKVESPVPTKSSEEAEPEPPTEGPDEAKTEVRGQKSEINTAKTSAPLIAQSSAELDESATPRQQPVTKKAALAPGAVRAIEKPSQATAKKIEKPKQTSEKISKTAKVETPKPEPSKEQIESPGEGPLQKGNAEDRTSTAEEPITVPSHLSPEASAKEESSSLSVQSSAEETPVDNSIRTLTGPPASLRTKSTPPPAEAPAPEISVPTVAPATSTNTPKLNAVQAMDIADIEARTKGYDLGDYQLPKAEYNASDDTWSVSYKSRGDKKTKHLSVTIQDKSGKAEVGK
jgi:hypothetical protein